MMSSDVSTGLLLNPNLASIYAGLAAHVVCNRFPPAQIPAFVAVLLAPPIALCLFLPTPPSIFLAIPTYLLTLGISIVLYRVSPLHPLAAYPGPTAAKITRWWQFRNATSGYQHQVSHELFHQYGDVVRTGPDHLIFRDPKAISTILGARNPWNKGGRYRLGQVDHNNSSLLQLSEPDHGKRRRVWDRAFTPAAVQSYTPMLNKRIGQLLEELSARLDTQIDLAEWLSYMSLDFMGDFAYGSIFDHLKAGRDPYGIRAKTELGLRRVEVLGTMPRTDSLLRVAVLFMRGRIRDVATSVAQKRKESGAQTKDLFYYLFDEDGQSGHTPFSDKTIAAEATLALVAGSDTTGTAMANAMFNLLCSPNSMNNLRRELDNAAAESSGLKDGASAAYDVEIDEKDLHQLPYLNAVVNETLRLQPALPNGAQRLPPPEGGSVIVAGHVVPVGTTCQVPTWSVHRDPRNFSPQTDGFWPERWLPEAKKLAEAQGQEYIHNPQAYFPFAFGPGNCAGRSLALHETRAVLVPLVRRFDFKFAQGFETVEWERNLKDAYALMRGSMPVVISARK